MDNLSPERPRRVGVAEAVPGPGGIEGARLLADEARVRLLAVHSLAAERVGATFIWNLDGAPPDDPRGGLLELAGAIQGPPLSVARRGHFPAVRSIASQVDLATVVAGDGSVGPFGLSLDHTVRAGELVPPINGARHTSARRSSTCLASWPWSCPNRAG